MESRRCRRVMAIFMTAVIIISFSAQSVYAAPVKTSERIISQVVGFKQTLLSQVASNITEIIPKDGKVLREGRAFWEALVYKVSSKLDFSEQPSGMQISNTEISTQLSDEITFIVLPEIQTDKSSETKLQKQAEDTAKVSGVSRSVGTEFLREDLDILARIIHAEARGESFEGQVAVGAVVLNRVKHPDFPKSIKEVVYQRGQFTAVDDRQIELQPNELAYKAAQAAMEGQDPSNGAIFYYNPKIATDRWIRTRSIIRSIGNHKFCV